MFSYMRHLRVEFLESRCFLTATTFVPEALEVASRNIDANLGDLDRDGKLDLVVASRADHTITWYQNLGAGVFSEPQVLDPTARAVRQVFASDVDSDLVVGTLDGQLTAMNARTIGDLNRDRIFNSSDLVALFQIGGYEDDFVGNADFYSGDWNGDGEFDSSDLILAMQSGHYQG